MTIIFPHLSKFHSIFKYKSNFISLSYLKLVVTPNPPYIVRSIYAGLINTAE